MKIKGKLPDEMLAKKLGIPDAGWEYETVTAEAESPDLLKDYGARGWELVTVVRDFGTKAVFYFKRRRQ